MANVSEIREHLALLVREQISLDDFEDWFVPYSWNIHKHGDEQAQQFAYQIEHALSLSNSDSAELRLHLSDLLGSFSAGSNSWGDPSQPLMAESNATSDFIEVAA